MNLEWEQNWLEQFDNRLEELMANYTDHFEYEDMNLGVRIVDDKPALRQLFKTFENKDPEASKHYFNATRYHGNEDGGTLEWTWKIAPGGNSGVLYHVVEDPKYKAPYETGPEYQMIDQLGFADPLEKWQSIGADYAMTEPDYEGVVKEAGEWNTSKIIFSEAGSSYYLNGKKTVEFVPYSEAWTTARNSGKWNEFPDYAISKTGLISLQDHGAETWFKNIKIRKL